MNVEILAILILVALNCVILGVFLYLNKLSMMSDAISHTILLGIVLGFLITHSLHSLPLMVGAIIIGLFSAWLIKLLKNTKKINEDAAIGIVFPFFFGIAIILITIFASNVHLDLDTVLLGEVIFAPLNRIDFLGISIPTALAWNSIALVLNYLFIYIFYKELKITTFDATYALISGFSITITQYLLLTFVSFNAVLAFDAVGSILVISLMIGPVISARLLTDRLFTMIVLSMLIAIGNIVIGYMFAIMFDVSIAGMIASAIGIVFLLIFIFAPQKGLLNKALNYQKRKTLFAAELMLLHLNKHQFNDYEEDKINVTNIKEYLNWDNKKLSKISTYLLKQNEVEIIDNKYYLTDKGITHINVISKKYSFLNEI